ncbi:MAG: hypothetical protein AAFY29_07980 [Pseudomonadota bacterium]
MFEPGSRYYHLDTATHEGDDGESRRYVKRRFLPRAERLRTLAEVTVDAGDRLDLISARSLGNSEQYWRICDAENAMQPDTLEQEPGRMLRVPVPEVNQ